MATVVITPRGSHPATYQPNTNYDFNVAWRGGDSGFDINDITIVDGSHALSFIINFGSGNYLMRVRTGSETGGRTRIMIRRNAVSQGNDAYEYAFNYGTGPTVVVANIMLSFSDRTGISGGYNDTAYQFRY